MKCLLLDHPGPPENLRLGSAESPLPGPGDVRVTVKAVGLNPADYKFLVRGVGSWSYPHIPGLDVAGALVMPCCITAISDALEASLSRR